MFHEKFIQLVDRYVPIKSFYNKNSHPPWLSKSILQAIKFKHKLWTKYKITRQISDYQQYNPSLSGHAIQLQLEFLLGQAHIKQASDRNYLSNFRAIALTGKTAS